MGQSHSETKGCYVASFNHSSKDGFAERVHCAAISIDSETLCSAGDTDVKIWSVKNARQITALRPRGAPFYAVSFNWDGSVVVIGCGGSKEIIIWDFTKGQAYQVLKGHDNRIYSTTFATKDLLSASGDRTIKRWDVPQSQCEATFVGHDMDVLCLAVSKDTTFFVSGSADSQLFVWDLQTGKRKFTLEGHTGEIRSVAISPNGLNIVSGGADGYIRLWHRRTGHSKGALDADQGGIYSLQFSDAGGLLASGGGDGTIKLWDFKAGTLLNVYHGHSQPVSCLIAVANPSSVVQLISSSWDGTIKFWPLPPVKPEVGSCSEAKQVQKSNEAGSPHSGAPLPVPLVPAEDGSHGHPQFPVSDNIEPFFLKADARQGDALGPSMLQGQDDTKA